METLMTSCEQGAAPAPGGDPSTQEFGIISAFPDELILLIFKYLTAHDLTVNVANVSKKWRALAGDPCLWKDRFIYYNWCRPEVFIQQINFAFDSIDYLHLGEHAAMEQEAVRALLASDICKVRVLKYYGSCRTHPYTVFQILSKFCQNLESLSICLNDELVSFGEDGETCYAIPVNFRPGLLITLLGKMKSLKYLKLHGGFRTVWYYGELLEEYCDGCNKIETLNFKEFEEVYDNFASNRQFDFITSLIMKNKDHLKRLYLPCRCHFNVGIMLRNCQTSLREAGLNLAHIKSLKSSMCSPKTLELSGRFKVYCSQEILRFQNFAQDVEEINLTEFADFNFSNSVCMFHYIKVLRIEGALFSWQDIPSILKELPLLVKLCVRETYAAARKHLIEIELNFTSLERMALFDDYDIQLDCFSHVTLKPIQVCKLKIYQAGCKCQNNPPGEEFVEIYEPEKSIECSKSRKIYFSLSRGLGEEFHCNFTDLDKSDRLFHFGE